LSRISTAWKAASEPALAGSDAVGLAVLILLDVLLCSVAALIPAGLTAIIYRKLKCQP
jgi:hypothetical protein